MARLYVISNPACSEVYIGKTCADLSAYLKYQLARSKAGSNSKPALYAAMRRNPFGWMIEELFSELTDDQAYRRERLLIALFDTQKNGLNRCAGGLGAVSGRIISPIHRARISASNKGRVLTPEQRAALSASLTGRKNPHGGMPWDEAARANMSASMKGRKITWADKISATRKGKPLTPENALKLRGRAGKFERTPEYIAKQREGIRLANLKRKGVLQ